MSLSAVVVGSGSAGRRHALALRALGDVKVTVVRRPARIQPVDELKRSGVAVVSSIDEVVADVDIGVVASPAPHHADAVDALAQRGVAALLVEKPLATNLDDSRRIDDAVRVTDTPTVVGYHLRYSDTPLAVLELLEGGTIGHPNSFHLSVGQHLTGWRKGVDPSSTVSAREDLGGGALNELSHEIDAVHRLLGPIGVVAARLRFDGAPTDGRVDTVADLDVTTTSGLAGTVHLDMVSSPPHRHWSISGTDGVLHADLLCGRITIEVGDKRRVIVPEAPPGERERAEGRLITHLRDVAGGIAEPLCSVDEGVAVVAVMEAARRSATAGAVPTRTGFTRCGNDRGDPS